MMPPEHATITVEICMGSSCFARGNREVVSAIQDLIRDLRLEERVLLKGALCQGQCQRGPNLTVNGRAYTNVSAGVALDILKEMLTGGRA